MRDRALISDIYPGRNDRNGRSAKLIKRVLEAFPEDPKRSCQLWTLFSGMYSMNPMTFAVLPLKKTRLGSVGSSSMRRGSLCESGKENSIQEFVFGLNRAILSTACSLTQTMLFFLSTVTE